MVDTLVVDAVLAGRCAAANAAADSATGPGGVAKVLRALSKLGTFRRPANALAAAQMTVGLHVRVEQVASRGWMRSARLESLSLGSYGIGHVC